MDPIEKCYGEALGWLREHASSRKLNPAHLLEVHFPSRPAPADAKMIDVIAVTESSAYSVVDPLTIDCNRLTFLKSWKRLTWYTHFRTCMPPASSKVSTDLCVGISIY